LAGAFFNAGAKALLVSHWYVDSRAAVQITTRTMDQMASDPSSGRAEAVRRTMAAMIANPATAHPALWAPFVVVGEGAR
jgi:CHAT domain-containing protein